MNPAGKIRAIEAGTKGSDEIVRQMDEITDERHLLPPTGVAVEAEAVLLRRGSGPRLVLQPTQPVASEPVPPALDGARMEAHSPGYGRGTAAVFRGQDDARPPSVTLTTGPRPNSALQFGTLSGVQRQPDARPAATGHATTASWPTSWAQLFCAPCHRSVPADFSGGIRGSGH